MATPTIDYDALAKQHGAVSSVDYDALAKQHGAVSSTPAGSRSAAEQLGVTNPIGKGILDTVEGIGSGVMSTVRGASQLAHKVIPAIPEVPASYAEAPDSFMGKAGKMGEQAAEFMLPMGAVSKATKGVGLAGRMAAEGLAAGGVSAVQSGGNPGATVAGTIAGAAGPAAGAMMQGAGKAIAESRIPGKLYQSALKPTWSMAKNEGLTMLDTGLKEQIPVSAEGLVKVEGKIKDLQAKINSGVVSRSKLGATVDSSKVLSALDDLKQFYKDTPVPGGTVQTGTKQVAGKVLDAAGNPIMETVPVTETVKGPLQVLNDIESQFKQFHGQKLSLEQAQQIKINTYQLIKDSYGEMASAKIEGLKQVARGLKDQISEAFPEISGDNEQQSKLLGLDEALTRAVWRIENHQVMGIGSPLAASGGHALLGGPGAVVGFVSKVLMDNPGLKSKLAIALSKSGVSNPTAVVGLRLQAMKAAAEKAASSFADSHSGPIGEPSIAAAQ